MPAQRRTETIPVRATGDIFSEVEPFATATDRSPTKIANQAIRQVLETNTWQIDRIRAGVTAAREGRVLPADKVFLSLHQTWLGALIGYTPGRHPSSSG